jgi:type IV pilus assembly protein PilY1
VAAATGDYDNTILESGKSMQNGHFYMLDLTRLGSDATFYSLTDNGTQNVFTDDTLAAGLFSYATLDALSFVTDPVTADFDLDFNADTVYFGTISGDSTGWRGKMRRIVTDDKNDPADWNPQSVLMDVGQPISAAPSVGKDDDERFWVYFGTGRYLVAADKTDMRLQSYYGVKEPLDNTGELLSWEEVTPPESTRPNGPNAVGSSPLVGSLVNVTNYQVFTNKDVLMVTGVALTPTVQLNSWEDLSTEQDNHSGWYVDFEADRSVSSVTLAGERNLGQAALLGGLVSFTTFTPDADTCAAGGSSDFWALYYKTGTAYYKDILGVHDGYDTLSGRNDRAKRSLGDQENNENFHIKGLATSPNIHTGREEGSAAFVQSSTGEIVKVEEKNPLRTKSGMQGWKLR